MEDQETEVAAAADSAPGKNTVAADAAAAAADSVEENADDTMIDVINESLEELLTKAQGEIDSALEAVAKKREELEAAEAEAEEKEEKMNIMREQAQALADDEQWQSMYHRLRAWSKEKGHCNPRRNWKSKIDAEEKALGNWVGKQRREERQEKLNPFKKAALERIGFAFDHWQHRWEEFQEKLKAWVSKHGKLQNINDERLKEADLQRQLIYWRTQAKLCIGAVPPRGKGGAGQSIRKEIKNNQFSQERIDFLTECGLNWNLSSAQVNALREKGFDFSLPTDTFEPSRPENGDIVALEKHSWLTMFEALVEFKKEHGHTFVSKRNSSEELYDWVCEQRKKMNQLKSSSTKTKAKATKDQSFVDYQSEMLSGVGFVHTKADIDWMENYERLVAFGRLFGTVAVTDKFCSFEVLQQWLDDNRRMRLSLPQLPGMSWARSNGTVSIHLAEREKLLDDIGAFDCPIGEEEIECRKSNYFFRTAEQVKGWDAGVLKSLRDKRKAALESMTNQSKQQEEDPPKEAEASSPAQSLHERCLKSMLSTVNIDPKKERDFFLKRGAIVSASVAEREKIPANGALRFYPDGRTANLCRISHCFSNHGGQKKHFLCARHFNMIEVVFRGESFIAEYDLQRADCNKESASSEAKSGESGGNDADESEIIHSCSNCNRQFNTYDDAAMHERNCGAVEEATKIPPPTNLPSHPPWTQVPMSDNLTGEAKVLAENYRCMVWKVTMEYRKKVSEQPQKYGNKFISAALGEKQPLKPDDSFHLPLVKFPRKQDEYESQVLFRRCGGPLAATLSGREKLTKDEKRCYGDGRSLRFCRVSGCQMVHAEALSKRYLCDWHHTMVEKQPPRHHTMIEKQSPNKMLGTDCTGKRKRVLPDQTNQKMSDARAYNRTKKASLPNAKLPSAKKGSSLNTPKSSAALYADVQKKIAAATANAVTLRKTKEGNYPPQMHLPQSVPVPNAMMFPPAKRTAASATKPAATTMPRVITSTASAPNASSPPATHLSEQNSSVLASSMKPAVTDDMKLGASKRNEILPLSSKKSKSIQKPSLTSAMAVETPLEPADSDIEEFMGC